MQTTRDVIADRGSPARVAVLFGGRSTEHEVSCRSAASVLRFLDRARYEVVPIRITRRGQWVVGHDPGPAGADAATLRQVTPEPASSAPMSGIAAAVECLRSVDVAFPCLHGPHGEDGTAQAVLGMAGVPYVGSGVLASATAMDKEFTKKILAAEGIAVADGVVLRDGEVEVGADDRARLGLPVFVKPARSGSSVGVSMVTDWGDLAGAVALARQCDPKVLVEAAVYGREVDIGLLQDSDGEVRAGPALEINVKRGHGFFDFAAKYSSGAAEFVVPANLEPEPAALLADTARRVFDLLGCAGLLRVDFFLTAAGGRTVPVLNEVNTMPGLTELSQFPRIWAAAGMSYGSLLDQLLSTALSRADVACV